MNIGYRDFSISSLLLASGSKAWSCCRKVVQKSDSPVKISGMVSIIRGGALWRENGGTIFEEARLVDGLIGRFL
jgi:hypothetical protein